MKRLKLTLFGALLALGAALTTVALAPKPARAAQFCGNSFCSGHEDHCFPFNGYNCNLTDNVCSGNSACS